MADTESILIMCTRRVVASTGQLTKGYRMERYYAVSRINTPSGQGPLRYLTVRQNRLHAHMQPDWTESFDMAYVYDSIEAARKAASFSLNIVQIINRKGEIVG